MLRLFLFGTIFAVSLFGQRQDRRIEPIVARHQLALVIGNSAYANQPLKNPVNDAQAMGRRLRELNYDVSVVTDAGYKAMGQAIDVVLDKLRTGDVAFFYYSGHGMQVEGENYLIPVDFRGQNETDVRYDAHAAGRIQERMEKSGAQLNILVLDACRNNPFRASSRSGTQGLAAMTGGRGTFIAFATAPGKTASDNPNSQNGLFTQYLLEALATPGLGLDDVFNLVRVRVDEASVGRQLPWTLSSVVGRYSFAPGSEAARSTPVESTPSEKPPARLDAGSGGLVAPAPVDAPVAPVTPSPKPATETADTVAPSNPNATATSSGDGFRATLLRWVTEAETDFASRRAARQWDPEGSLLGSHCAGATQGTYKHPGVSFSYTRCDWPHPPVDQATAERQFNEIAAKTQATLLGWKQRDIPQGSIHFFYFTPPPSAKSKVVVRLQFARLDDGTFGITCFVETLSNPFLPRGL